MKIAVTGADGFPGRELVSYLSAQGHEVIRLQQESIAGPMDRFFDMRSVHSIPDLMGIDVLLHADYIGYDPRHCPDSTDINISTAMALQSACRKAGVKFIFLSAMSAHADAVSPYGKHKYEIEQRLDLSQDLVLKSGLIIGNGGIVKKIKEQLTKSPFIRLGKGVQTIQIIDVFDLCPIIEKAIVTNATGIYHIATEKAYPIRDIYHTIGKKLNKKPIFLPWGSSDMDELRDISVMDVAQDLAKLSVEIPGNKPTPPDKQ